MRLNHTSSIRICILIFSSELNNKIETAKNEMQLEYHHN